jgi:hypothetical protein
MIRDYLEDSTKRQKALDIRARYEDVPEDKKATKREVVP